MNFFKKLNLPNKLTLLRMIGVIIEIFLCILDFYFINSWNLVFNSDIKVPYLRIIMLVIFILATATDFLDGYLARKNNQVTTFGKFLDPIADKLLNNSLFIYFSFTSEISFIVPIIYIFRDTIVDGLRMLAASKNKVLAASIMGKAKTVLQVFAIISIFILSPLTSVYNFSKIIIIILVSLATLASLISGIEYLYKNKEAFKEK